MCPKCICKIYHDYIKAAFPNLYIYISLLTKVNV